VVCLGRTTVKCRRSRVATSLSLSRSATANNRCLNGAERQINIGAQDHQSRHQAAQGVDLPAAGYRPGPARCQGTAGSTLRVRVAGS